MQTHCQSLKRQCKKCRWYFVAIQRDYWLCDKCLVSLNRRFVFDEEIRADCQAVVERREASGWNKLLVRFNDELKQVRSRSNTGLVDGFAVSLLDVPLAERKIAQTKGIIWNPTMLWFVFADHPAHDKVVANWLRHRLGHTPPGLVTRESEKRTALSLPQDFVTQSKKVGACWDKRLRLWFVDKCSSGHDLLSGLWPLVF